MPDAVTDTHALLFHVSRNSRLGPRARRLFTACDRREALIWVPAAVMWEVSALARAGRVRLQPGFRRFFDDLFTNPGFQPLPTSAAQVIDADELHFTRDPFDALIVAAARERSVPLITRDLDITASGLVTTVW
jgi:PIN domain nuclease of toxin-antitoxin system